MFTYIFMNKKPLCVCIVNNNIYVAIYIVTCLLIKVPQL